MIEKAIRKLSKMVDEGEIFYQTSRTSTVTTKKHSIESFKEKLAVGYGIRVLNNNRMGFYFSNTLDDDALMRAVEVTKHSQEDENLSLPDKQKYRNLKNKICEVELDKGIEMAEALIEGCSDIKGVNPTSGAISWNSSQLYVANTNGVHGEKEEFLMTTYLYAVAEGTEPSTGFHFEVSNECDIKPFKLGHAAGNLAKESLNGEKIETGKKAVILKPMAATELLEYTLIPSFSADNVQRGRSKLMDREGEEIFQEISIVDDATLDRGLMTEQFDDEGVATEKTVLVNKGILQGFLYDTYTAYKGSRRSTGNSVRSSYSSPPSVGPSNFIVKGMDKLDNERDSLMVNGLIGAHTSNPISGDFSCETRNAFLDGKPIKKAIISGNIFDILKGGVRLGADVKQYSSIVTPSILFPGIVVVG